MTIIYYSKFSIIRTRDAPGQSGCRTFPVVGTFSLKPRKTSQNVLKNTQNGYPHHHHHHTHVPRRIRMCTCVLTCVTSYSADHEARKTDKNHRPSQNIRTETRYSTYPPYACDIGVSCGPVACSLSESLSICITVCINTPQAEY